MNTHIGQRTDFYQSAGSRRLRDLGRRAHRTSRMWQLLALSSIDMRFHPLVVFARLCGAAGLGVFLGAAASGLVNIVTGWAFIRGNAWVTGVPVLAILGGIAGVTIAWLTRRWLMPEASRRRLLFTAAGALAAPAATAAAQGEPNTAVTFPLIFAGTAMIVTLWVQGFRRETQLARSVSYSRRPLARG